MKNNYIRIPVQSLVISIVGILVIDYLSHLFFSNPMETPSYFLAKMTLYFLFSIAFLSVFSLKKDEFYKIVAAGIIVAALWGIYYNILPLIFNFYPFGIPLAYLSFLGMGLLGTGLAFGTVHTLAFIGGYYVSKLVFKKFW